MLEVLANATSAVRAYSRGVLVAAHNIANSITDNYQPQEASYQEAPGGGVVSHVGVRPGVEGVDMAEESVNLASSQRAIEANLAVIRASDKTLGVLLDTFG